MVFQIKVDKPEANEGVDRTICTEQKNPILTSCSITTKHGK